MGEELSAKSLIRFGDCEINLAGYEVRRNDQPCVVEPQVFELLAYLVCNPARLVTKAELFAKVWSGRIVSDSALSSRIKSARRAIGDDGEQQRFIRTVHGRGFRFVGDLASSEQSPGRDVKLSSVDVAVPELHGKTGSGRPSIAVLPLRRPGSDEADCYLTETVIDDIVTCLVRDRTLAVSTQSDFLLADGSTEDRELNVQAAGPRYLLEGGVRRAGDRLFVTARLTDAADGTHLWAERCEQSLCSPPLIDDRIARMISAMVRSEIETAEAKKAATGAKPDWDAWAHYHLGLKKLYRFTRSDLVEAQTCFERALTIDPEFASASARLAYVHVQEYWYGQRDRRVHALHDAQIAAARAIALDPKNSLGYIALGRIHALQGEFDLAIPMLETAIRLNPGLAQAYFSLGQTHHYADRPKEAVRLIDIAMELNPYDAHFWSFLHDQSDAYYALGRLSEAERGTNAASRPMNATHWPFASHASVLGTAGKIDEARQVVCKLRTRWPEYTLSTARAELVHFRSKTYVEEYVQGLKAAGLPDELPGAA